MITIFTIPKPFTDPHISLIQTNAILSWQRLHPDIEVILIGNDQGIASFARKHRLKHITQVKKNQYGTPLLNSAFLIAQKEAHHDLIMYTNADIIFTRQLVSLIKKIPANPFLIAGSRFDLDVTSLINFKNINWDKKILNQAKTKGKIHPPLGSDYFIFRKNTLPQFHAFAVGRVGWDNWLLHQSFRSGLQVVDASPINPIIHQNHHHRHQLGDGKAVETNPEALETLNSISAADHHFTLKNIKFRLTDQGVTRRYRPKDMIISVLLLSVLTLGLSLRLGNLTASLQQVKNDLFYPNSTSLDEQMVQLYGQSYRYYQLVNQITPSDSIIYYPDIESLPSDYRGILAAYFIFPRRLSPSQPTIQFKNFVEYQRIHASQPQFIAVMSGFPPFVFKSKRTYFFNPTLDDFQVFEKYYYNPKKNNYSDRYGLIEL